MAACDLSGGAQGYPSFDALGGCTANLIKVFITLCGVAALVMFLIGTVKYITSGGDDKAIAEAKNTLTYAIIGIVIVALSYSLISLIDTLVLGGTGRLLTFPSASDLLP